MAILTRKQQLFVDEYLVDLNATQAAIRAGYSPHTAYSIGSRHLTKPEIEDAVDNALALRANRTRVNSDMVVLELAKIAFINPADMIDMATGIVRTDASKNDTAVISSVKVKITPKGDTEITEREIKTYDKIKALELLGKHIGMFRDTFKIEGGVPVVIVDDLGDDDE